MAIYLVSFFFFFLWDPTFSCYGCSAGSCNSGVLTGEDEHTSFTPPFNITGIQVYALTNNAKEAEAEWFYDDLQDFLELTPKKDVLFT